MKATLDLLLASQQAAVPECKLVLRLPGAAAEYLQPVTSLSVGWLESVVQFGEFPVFQGLPQGCRRVLGYPLGQRSHPGYLLCLDEGGTSETLLVAFAQALRAIMEPTWTVENLNTLLDRSLELIVVADSDGHVLYTTPSFQRLLTLQQVLPLVGEWRNFLDLVHREDRLLVQDTLLRLQGGECSVGPLEYRLRCGQSGDCVFLESWFSLHQIHKDYNTTVIYSRDVTQRKQAANALISRERRYRQVLDELSQAVFEMDLEGRLTFVNVSWEKMTGCSRVQSVGQSLHQFFELPQPLELPLHREVYSRGGPAGPWWVELWLHPLRNGRGILGLALDITERKLMQRQLDKMAQLVDQAIEIVILLDSYGRVSYVNPAYALATGSSQRDLLWQPFFDVFRHPEGLSGEEILLDVHRLKSWMGRLRCGRPSGEDLTVDAVISRVFDEQGQFREYLVTCRDLTREKRLEDQLMQSQRLESLGLLAGGIAHDFSNLLQIIQGNTALEQLKTREEGRSPSIYLHDLNEAAQRGQRLTRQLLTFASQQPVKEELLDLCEVLSETVPVVQRWFPKSIEFRLQLSPTPCWVQADRSQLEQVILNLTVNARDAMPKGGCLTIRLSQPEEDRCLLSFADTGVGLTEDLKRRIFEPFFTTKSKDGQGSGLGLAVVYGTIRRHGGSIQVESEPGQGTCFDIELPCAPRAANRGTILIAEDEALVLGLNAGLLERHGYRVLLAKDGQEAVQLFHQEQSNIDGLVLDVEMPRMDGVEAFRRIRQENGQIPTLFCSVFAREALNLEGPLEVVDFLAKPYEAEELLSKLQRLLSA